MILKIKKIFPDLSILLYFISLVFTVTNLGGPYIGIPNLIFRLVFVGTIFWLFLTTQLIYSNRNEIILLVIFIPFVFLNSFFSINSFDSAFYWTFWLMFIFSIAKLIRIEEDNAIKRFFQNLPYILFTATLILYLILLPYIGRGLPTMNSLGIISGSSLIAALNIRNIFHRWGIFSFSLFVLAVSNSRSSLAFAIFIIILYFLSTISLKKSPLLFISILLILFFQNNIYDILEEKMTSKEYNISTLDGAIESAYGVRAQLILQGIEVFKESPILGHGLKSKYYIGKVFDVPGNYVHVHNGYLGTLIESGLIISIILLIFIFIIIKRILTAIILHPNRVNKVWVALIFFGFIRAYGENYLFFNIGNIFSISFIILCMIIVIKPKLVLFTKD